MNLVDSSHVMKQQFYFDMVKHAGLRKLGKRGVSLMAHSLLLTHICSYIIAS